MARTMYRLTDMRTVHLCLLCRSLVPYAEQQAHTKWHADTTPGQLQAWRDDINKKQREPQPSTLPKHLQTPEAPF